MEDAELGCHQQELQIKFVKVELAIVAEIRNHIDDRGRHKRYEQRLRQKQPWVLTGELCIANNKTDIAKEDYCTNDGDDNYIGKNKAGGKAGYVKVQGIPTWGRWFSE